MRDRPEPKFSLMQCVHLRGRYEPASCLKKGIIVGMQYSESGIFLPCWWYDIQWENGDTVGMMECDIESGTLGEIKPVTKWKDQP